MAEYSLFHCKGSGENPQESFHVREVGKRPDGKTYMKFHNLATEVFTNGRGDFKVFSGSSRDDRLKANGVYIACKGLQKIGEFFKEPQNNP